ncbi:hypothetical protein [Pontibacillus yanchengensis]|uniref:Uncharacterized protein n=1 Tax=Pontibacillus yanchengensis Y32 TaxID=1385514 RepID=A0A0A2TA65_9BACI|nr:hypothetical protein [Pontibacillus yanchengensis]KGP71298.1 hypothetical protein N782_20125 [Pontibacillus yanchengensis Y32]
MREEALIKQWTYFYLFVTFYLISIILNFPFPHEYPLGEQIISIFGIPLATTQDVQYLGIATLVIFITSLFFLGHSLVRYHKRLIILAIILSGVIPAISIDVYQNTLASGIYAVSYNRDASSCNFNMIEEDTLQGECELPLKNNSGDQVSFSIGFYEDHVFERRTVSIMNEKGPYQVTLEGHEQKELSISTTIDVSQMESHIENGSASHVNIKLSSGEAFRDL